jgi:hypothetical protein
MREPKKSSKGKIEGKFIFFFINKKPTTKIFFFRFTSYRLYLGESREFRDELVAFKKELFAFECG